MRTRVHRRSLLGTVGTVIAGGIAGCGGGGITTDEETTDDGTTDLQGAGTGPGGTDTGTSPETPTNAQSPTTERETESRPSVDEFLADTSNYDGVVDLTGSDSVGVDVGAEGNGAFFAFDPPAIRIDRGTTVTWTWTGQGGPHNVAAVHGETFESEVTTEEGATFQQTLDESGTVLYACSPHRGAGMKGAIVVE